MNSRWIVVLSYGCAFVAFLALFFLFPHKALRAASGGSGFQYALLFIVPGAVATLAAISASVMSQATWAGAVSPIASWTLIGVEMNWGLFSLLVLFSWYDTPGNGKLEPLFVTYGLAIGGSEAIRRVLERMGEGAVDEDEPLNNAPKPTQ